MTDITGTGFSAFSAISGVPANMSRMAEPELVQWAEQKAVNGNADTPLVRIGFVLFWAVVAVLLLARIFVIDPAKFRPAESASTPAASAFHLAPNAKP